MKKILATTSVLAIMALAIAPAQANDQHKSGASTRVEAHGDTTIGQDIERGWENTKEGVSEAAKNTSAAVSEAYEDVKFTLLGSEKTNGSVVINSRMTADGMIGKPVDNTVGDQVAVLHDVIVAKDGKLDAVVVSDADFIAAGSKQAAFDYGLVSHRDRDGDIITPLSETSIDKARSFSYDTKDAGKENIRVLPAGSYSARKLLDAEILDSTGKKVAAVDNITFKGGKADMLVIGYDKVMGVGGEDAALPFAAVKLVPKAGGAVDFQLSAAQSQQFEAFKNVASKNN